MSYVNNTWYQQEPHEVLSVLQSDEDNGLSESESAYRLQQRGPNELTERDRKTLWLVLLSQFKSTMVLILCLASGVSLILGDYEDSVAIFVIVLLNAAMGFHQEYRAEKALLALKKMAVPNVRVRRSGLITEISARGLVVGDVVLLEAGNIVPADCRLLQSTNLRVQEAALTGESEPVSKDMAAIHTQLALPDRKNMVYRGTIVTGGRCSAVVTAIGNETEIGRIAGMLADIDRETTPLQQRMNRLGRQLAGVALILVTIIFVAGIWRGEQPRLMFLTAVSLAVAAIPEGLPAVVTIALAIGAQKMLKRKALIRKLPAVETLGSVTVICSDKTGTLTENHMTVTRFELPEVAIDISPASARPAEESLPASFRMLLTAATLCNDAMIGIGPHQSEIGDPTEVALLIAAQRFGLDKSQLTPSMPRVNEIPFDSERKRMTTIHRLEPSGEFTSVFAAAGSSNFVAFTKGAPGPLLALSSHVWIGYPTELDASYRRKIIDSNNALADRGMRLLGVAFRLLSSAEEDNVESEMIFLGTVAMMDPLRSGVKEAVHTCLDAGIRPVLITGDHPRTARTIARELEFPGTEQTLSGEELDRIPENELATVVGHVQVYARVSPSHKLSLVQALQRKHEIVAMTGDGINDAPALKKADIGIAMGITGTDVAKEAADMVLLDDNFATIVSAVEEGRIIFDNIRKFVRYILATNSGELWVMLLASFFGMPLPLLPVQILWMNLVTDGLPALALGFEPAERGIMKRRPYPANAGIFAAGMPLHILWVGILMACLSVAGGLYFLRVHLAAWQTILFTILTISQMAHVLAIRSERDSFLAKGLFTNMPLLGAVLLTTAMQVAIIYVPLLQRFFKTVPLTASQLLLCFGLSALIFVAVEIEKWILRQRSTPFALPVRIP